MFPYFRTTDANKEDIDNSLGQLFGSQIETRYVASAKHCKYSVSDDRYKAYEHILYKATLSEVPECMQRDSFEIKGIRYSWKSYSELEMDQDVMNKNDDIIAFVKTNLIKNRCLTRELLKADDCLYLAEGIVERCDKLASSMLLMPADTVEVDRLLRRRSCMEKKWLRLHNALSPGLVNTNRLNQ